MIISTMVSRVIGRKWLPRARNTYDGSSDADVQALPDESAMSYSKEMNTVDRV